MEKEGEVINKAEKLKVGDKVTAVFSDGKLIMEVKEKNINEN